MTLVNDFAIPLKITKFNLWRICPLLLLLFFVKWRTQFLVYRQFSYTCIYLESYLPITSVCLNFPLPVPPLVLLLFSDPIHFDLRLYSLHCHKCRSPSSTLLLLSSLLFLISLILSNSLFLFFYPNAFQI